MYVGQTKQILEVGTIKENRHSIYNMVTSKSQMCMVAKPPYPMKSTTSNWNT